jgi:D-threo-aldose 1-dehydrogenase
MKNADFSSCSIQSRPLGQTEVRLPVLGFGAAPLGNLYEAVDEASAQSTVQTALAQGIRYFDTAPLYGFGLSETRLGEALQSHSQAANALISTKVGRVLSPLAVAPEAAKRNEFVSALPNSFAFDYSYDGVMRSFEASLKRLRVSRLTILLAHDLGRTTHGNDHPMRWKEFLEGGFKAMRELREQQLVGALGIGVNEVAICVDALQSLDLDCILLAGRYTLLEQDASETLLSECVRRRVSVIVGGPFNSGILVEDGDRRGTRHYNYAPAPPPIVERVERLKAICSAHRIAIGAAALQFPLAHPAVISVIPGIRSKEQLRDAACFITSEIPAAFWNELRHAGLLSPTAPIPAAGVGPAVR